MIALRVLHTNSDCKLMKFVHVFFHEAIQER